jgi:hypothetical protein
MSSLTVQFRDGRQSFSPGESVSVDLRWELESEPDRLELRCVWNTSGKGSTDIGVEKSVSIDTPGRSGSRQINLELPTAPYSFSGKLVSLIWALELVAQPSEESCRQEFILAPDGREVLLHRETDGTAGDE